MVDGSDSKGNRPGEAELALVRLLVEGMTDQATMAKLGWSERTFRRHLRAVQDRLGARSRIQTGYLVAMAGWLGEPAGP